MPEEVLAVSSSKNAIKYDQFFRDRDRNYDDLLDAAADPYVPLKAADEFQGDIKQFRPIFKDSFEKMS